MSSRSENTMSIVEAMLVESQLEQIATELDDVRRRHDILTDKIDRVLDKVDKLEEKVGENHRQVVEMLGALKAAVQARVPW